MTSTTGLEQEAERRRAEMVDTAERLRAKLTPGQLLDEFTHTLRDGDWGVTLKNLKTQVRDNPLALAMVGAGMAWLMAGGSGQGPAPSGDARNGMATGAANAASGALDATGDALAGWRDGAARAGSALENEMSAGFASAKSAARHAGGRARAAAHSLEDGIADILEREPLVLGALGVAIGAAVGALLPSTRFEDESLGAYRDRLRKEGSDALRGSLREAGHVATSAGKAALDEADQQGLIPGSGDRTFARKVERVAERAVEEVRDAAGRRFDSVPEASDRPQRPG